MSVRLSVCHTTLVYCIQTAEGFSLPGSPVILVTRGHLLPIIKGNPRQWGVRYTGWEKPMVANRYDQYPFINEKMSTRTVGQKMGEINVNIAYNNKIEVQNLEA